MTFLHSAILGTAFALSIAAIAHANQPNGSQCQSDGQCLSGACQKFAPNAPQNYCLDRQLNCAWPGSNGARYDDRWLWRDNNYWLCKRGTGDWQKLGNSKSNLPPVTIFRFP